ncbi:hypothetical protein, partial [Bacillus sp. JJ1474]
MGIAAGDINTEMPQVGIVGSLSAELLIGVFLIPNFLWYNTQKISAFFIRKLLITKKHKYYIN